MNKSTVREITIQNESGIYGLGLAALPYDENKTRYLRITDIDDNGSLLYDDKKSIECDNLSSYILQQNDLVVARTGNSTGRTYMYSKEDGVLAYAGFLIKYVFDNNKINPRYLKYYCLSKPYKEQIKRYVGSTRGNMSAQDFFNIEVLYPNRDAQDKIVTLFDAMDKCIKNNNAMANELESIARDVYYYWLIQFDFPDENGHPYKSSGGKMEWNEKLKRNIPAGWEVKSIGELLEDKRGISYSSKTIEGDGVPMINLASFTPDGQYNVDGLKVYSGEYSKDKILKPYDLVICNTQQTAIDFEKDIIGKALLVPDIFDGDIVSSHHVTSLRVYDDDMKYYLFRLFNTDYFHKFITGYTNGTNILGLLFDSVKQCEIEIPDKETLRKFAKIIHTIESKKSNIIKENQELVKLRDFLLPMLMSGQVHF